MSELIYRLRWLLKRVHDFFIIKLGRGVKVNFKVGDRVKCRIVINRWEHGEDKLTDYELEYPKGVVKKIYPDGMIEVFLDEPSGTVKRRNWRFFHRSLIKLKPKKPLRWFWISVYDFGKVAYSEEESNDQIPKNFPGAPGSILRERIHVREFRPKKEKQNEKQ